MEEEADLEAKKEALAVEVALWNKRIEHLKREAEVLGQEIEKKKREKKELERAASMEDDPLLGTGELTRAVSRGEA